MTIDLSRLRGRHVYLLPLKQEHVPTLRALIRDARLWEYTRTLIIDDTFDEQFDRYMALAFDSKNAGEQYSFVIHEATTQRIIGMTRYYKMEPSQKRLSIGYTWYIPDVWGRVHNKECKLLLLQYAFESLRFQRVEFEVAGQNLRSQKAVEKIGGVREGVLRKHGIMADGTVRDTVVFSITDEEWPAKKEALLQLVEQQ
jgi:RimJ/RimL family protein N-acetyltransferase